MAEQKKEAESTAVTKKSGPLEVFREALQQQAGAFTQVIPESVRSYMTPERITRIMLAAISRTPALAECSIPSILRVCMDAATLGLEPCGPLGHLYAVPFNNAKSGKKEAQTIVGYRGLIELARRSGKIGAIESHVVHEKDGFEIVYGREPKLTHTPYLGAESPGEVVAAYVIADITGGGRQVEVMTRSEIDAVRKRSRAGSSGPWVTDFAEMARKTVLRRAWKYWPMSIEMADASEKDFDGFDHGDVVEARAALSGPPPEGRAKIGSSKPTTVKEADDFNYGPGEWKDDEATVVPK